MVRDLVNGLRAATVSDAVATTTFRAGVPHGGEQDDAIAMWKVCAARATAWANAEVLWAL